MTAPYNFSMSWYWLLTAMLIFIGGCASAIAINPEPSSTSLQALPYSVRVEVSQVETRKRTERFASTGLSSRAQDLQTWTQAVAEYFRKRQLFREVVTDGEADLVLAIKVRLWYDPGVSYSPGYLVDLDGVLTTPKNKVIGAYRGLAETPAELIRLTQASDDIPINQALSKALDQLASNIEAEATTIGANL